MRPDIVPGGTFPDYELPDHTRVLRRLSELQGDDPMILTLPRGHYCPKEHEQHLELAAFYPKVAVGYTRIATISTDTHHASQELRAWETGDLSSFHGWNRRGAGTPQRPLMPFIPELLSAPALARMEERGTRDSRACPSSMACSPARSMRSSGDSILTAAVQPFPTFSEIYLSALEALHEKIAPGRRPVTAGMEEVAR